MADGKEIIVTSAIWGRLISTIAGMKIHLQTGGKLKLTRTATPGLLRSIATEFTGKLYPRSTQGMESALKDLEAIRDDIKAQMEAAKV